MIKKKELEFNINGNLLEVSDFAWWIDRIDAIHIGRIEKNYIECFAIFIETNNELDRLYFMGSFKKIHKEFIKLCNALNEVNDKIIMCGTSCYNFGNIQDIKYSKYDRLISDVPQYYVEIQYANSNRPKTINFLSKDQLGVILENYNNVKCRSGIDLQQ